MATHAGFGSWWGDRSVIERRAVIGAVSVVIGWVLLLLFSSFDLSAVLVALVFLALYVPTWDRIPVRVRGVRLGRLVVPLALIVIALTYPFFWDKLFDVPIFGPFPAVGTGVYMLVFIMRAIGLIQAFNEGLNWHAPGSDWTQSIVFSILILILVFRPEGLLGERTPEGG